MWLMAPLGEWLETDGLGGFSSSTISGIHTRRYHGWLFIATKDPGERFLCLSKFEDCLITPGGQFWLSSNKYPGTVYPNGLENLYGFTPYPFPKFTFKVGEGLLEREIFMVKGMRGIFVTYKYSLDGSQPGTLVIRPLLNFRFYHHLSKEGSFKPRINWQGKGLAIEGHPQVSAVLISGGQLEFREKPVWYKNMLYAQEQKRGLDYAEDHFCPGEILMKVTPGQRHIIWVGPIYDDKVLTLGEDEGESDGGNSVFIHYQDFTESLAEKGPRLREREIRRRKGILENPRFKGKAKIGPLLVSADSFIIQKGDLSSIIAGYHWFSEWGRDTFISLPGLLLTRQRFDTAKRVFLRFSDVSSGGLIPNTFWAGEGAYNSVDASLWFIRALALYEKASGDKEFVQKMLPKVKDIVKSFIAGTKNVKMSNSGLIWAGNEGTQVTWMDACVNGKPVTPRNGFPCEINALWVDVLFNLSRWLEELTANAGERNDYSRLYLSARKEFREKFIWPEKGLYDCVGHDGPLAEVRPNMVIAASIGSLNLPDDVLKKVFHTALKELLTPFGLRTLAKDSPCYIGSYSGGPLERDKAYHQGSSWPFLLGFLFDLAKLLQQKDASRSSRHFDYSKVFSCAVNNLLPLGKNPCVTSIFELTSGDPPYERGGTVAQAWSVSEILRILVEGDVKWV